MKQSSQDIANNLLGKSADEISEENIQLFLRYIHNMKNSLQSHISFGIPQSISTRSFFNRCEEYVKEETEMEQTVSLIPQYDKHLFVSSVLTSI